MNHVLHAFRLLVMCMLATVAVGSLSACESAGLRPDASFVKATRLMHDAIALDYVSYVQQDESLTPEQRQNRVNAVGDWEFLIRQAEKNLAVSAIPSGQSTPRAPPLPEGPDGGGVGE